jgi:hypothetical protein
MIAANGKLLSTPFEKILQGRFEWPDTVIQPADEVGP